MRELENKNPAKFKNYLKWSLSEQKSKTKIIYRKGGAKCPKSLVYNIFTCKYANLHDTDIFVVERTWICRISFPLLHSSL